MKLEQDGQIITENTEKNEPFSLYKNSGGDMFGKYLPAGDYKSTWMPNDDPTFSFSDYFTMVDCGGQP